MQGKPQSTRMDLIPRQSAILTGITLEAVPIPLPARQEAHNKIVQENKRAGNATARLVDSATLVLKATRIRP